MDKVTLQHLQQTFAQNLASLDANIADRNRQLAEVQARVRELTTELQHLGGAREYQVNIVGQQLQLELNKIAAEEYAASADQTTTSSHTPQS